MDRFDALFELLPRRPLYPTFREELGGIQADAKCMSFFEFSHADVVGDSGEATDYEALIRFAFECGLSVVHHPVCDVVQNVRSERVLVMVLKPEQMWRVPAFIALTQVDGSWSDRMERIQSRLLGYQEDQTEDWLRRKQRLGLPRISLVLVLKERDIQAAQAANMGCLPSDLDDAVVIRYSDDVVVRPDAIQNLRGVGLLRVVVGTETIASIFGRSKLEHGRIETRELSAKATLTINRSLRSRIEILTDSGWL